MKHCHSGHLMSVGTRQAQSGAACLQAKYGIPDRSNYVAGEGSADATYAPFPQQLKLHCYRPPQGE